MGRMGSMRMIEGRERDGRDQKDERDAEARGTEFGNPSGRMWQAGRGILVSPQRNFGREAGY